MKKLFLGLGLCLIGAFSQAQGLEGIVVEKYYKANAADAAGSSGTLPVGSVTYRIYADMLPGYKFQMAYGNAAHNLKLETTTSFFNNEDRGATTPAYTKVQAKLNTVMLDSWLSVGAGCAANFGVMKSEDDGVANVVNSNSLLANTDASIGIPLTTQDGLVAGAPQSVTFVGISTELSVFDATSQTGNSFVINNGAWSSLSGSTGPLASNRILIAQITTDGIFHYELNIQIGTPLGDIEKYVTGSPAADEITIPSLVGTYGAPNAMPTVSITTPTTGASYITGDAVTIDATAADADGSVSSVQFFVDGTSVGIDNTAPYSTSWTSTVGAHSITAKATDNEGGQTTSTAVMVTAVNNQLPTVSITAPAAASVFNKDSMVSITATAADADGSVSKVEFYVNNVKVGEDLTSPYQYDWTAVEGATNLTAKATDNLGAVKISAVVAINVVDPSGGPYNVLTGSGPCSTDLFSVPVSRVSDSLHNCTGFDFVMSFNKYKVVPTGVVTIHNALIDSLRASYSVDMKDTSINVSVFLNSSAPVGTGFNGLGKLFSVEFSKVAGFNAVDTAIFTVPFMMESYSTSTITKSVKSGKYISYKDSIFNGKLKFWSNNSPIAYNAATPALHLITNIYGNTNPTIAVQPDTMGVFNFNINNGDSIKIVKDINDTTNVMPVINGYDAFLTQKVLVDDPSFIPTIYQIIAMDVNMDGVVSAGDLSQINQRTVLTSPQFTQLWNASNAQSSKDMLFVALSVVQTDLGYKKSATYPANDGVGYSKLNVPTVSLMSALPINNFLTCPEIGAETYKGILLGDINGSYATVVNPNINKTEPKVMFDLLNAVVAGNIIDIPVSITTDEVVNSLDFSTKFNSENLSFVKVNDNSNSLHMLSNVTANNTLMFTSSSLQNYVNAPVSVRFNSNSGVINTSDLSSIKAYLNGEKVGVEVNATGITENKSDAQGIQVYPNPATNLLHVEVTENSTVQLLDMNGKQIFVDSKVNANLNHVFNLQNLANGVYFIKVVNEKFTAVKKVVVNK